MSILTLDQFRSAWKTGGLVTIGVKASGCEFFVHGHARNGSVVTLATTRGKVRRGFRDPGKAIAVLHGIGIGSIEVETSDWSPELAEGHSLEDTSERGRRTHEAAAYDAWFRAEVEQALREADDPEAVWVSDEEVQKQSAALEAELLTKIEAGCERR